MTMDRQDKNNMPPFIRSGGVIMLKKSQVDIFAIY